MGYCNEPDHVVLGEDWSSFGSFWLEKKITECSELNELLLELRDENVDRNADEGLACEISEEVQVSQ